MTKRAPPLYYSLHPVHAPKPGEFRIANASVATCMATGRVLDGMDGGGLFLSTDIVHALDMNRAGPKSRMVLDTDDYEAAKAALSAVVGAQGATAAGEAAAMARSALERLVQAEDEGRAPGRNGGDHDGE